jgi:hypothetical protein
VSAADAAKAQAAGDKLLRKQIKDAEVLANGHFNGHLNHF